MPDQDRTPEAFYDLADAYRSIAKSIDDIGQLIEDAKADKVKVSVDQIFNTFQVKLREAVRMAHVKVSSKLTLQRLEQAEIERAARTAKEMQTPPKKKK